jgi:uncharacterized protein (TIGR02300 family)
VSKPELGVKRLCANCGAKFYDLHRDPIVCPKCTTVFVPPAPNPITPRRLTRPWPVPVEKAAMPEPELVSPKRGEEAAELAEDETTSVETLDGATVLAEEDDADEDVGSVVGDGEEDEQA